MVSAKGKGNASISISSPKKDTAKTTLTEKAVSVPEKTNPADTEEKMKLKLEEVMNGEKAVVVVTTEETVIAEENNGDNAIEEEKDNEENSMEEENNEEDAMEEEKTEEDAMEEEKTEENTGKQNKEKVEESSKGIGRKLRKRSGGKKGAREGSKAVVAKGEDKPESSDKNKAPKKVESMGMIFMCSSKTKKDCYRYNVLGLPASKKDLVQKVYKGMRLFLYDFDKKLMYGIYKAAGPGGYDIVPKAFKSSFPSQVRFTVLEDCLPLAEEKFKKVIKDNYYSRNKFDCQLTSKQVKELCKLFVATRKGAKSRKTNRSLREEKPTSGEVGGRIRGGRIKRRVLDRERPSSSRRDMDRDHRYIDRPVRRYARESFASPRVAPPLDRVPPPSYAYEVDAYRVDPYLDPRGPRYLELPPRHIDEPYVSYRDIEPRSYRDPMYSDLPPEYPLPVDYRAAGRVVEYPLEYHAPASLRPEYRIVGPSAEYHSSAALSEDYPPRSLYRY